MGKKIWTIKEIRKAIIEHNIIPVEIYNVPKFNHTRVFNNAIVDNQKDYMRAERQNKILIKKINNKRYM